jgi:ribosome biogenesis GTPase
MKGKSRKSAREKDLTARYLSGGLDEDRVEQQQRFSDRNKHAQANKMIKTAAKRAVADEGAGAGGDVSRLPVGEVVQVYSLYLDVRSAGRTYLCSVRKTMAKVSATGIVVGDRVRFRASGVIDAQGRPEAIIEQILPRDTILTRADSFKGADQHPIVANAEQMLIVVSLRHPAVKWGLVDRMLIAAQSGKLKPIICLNKIDLEGLDAGPQGAEIRDADASLAHYATLGATTLKTSADQNIGLDALRDLLENHTTVLAGHSGVGKSSLIRALQPSLDIRVGEISAYTAKGRHTTTSARRYDLDFGGAVIDTPGVKHFGLWGVTRDNLEDFFPDLASENPPDTAPAWRRQSYQRIAESLK